MLASLLLSLLASQNAFAEFPSPKDEQENKQATTNTKSVEQIQSIEVAIKNAIDKSLQPFSGSVLLFQNGRPLLSLNKGRGVNQRTSFVIASLSKQITATLVLRAVDAGNLDLNNSLNSYLFANSNVYDQNQQNETEESEDFDAKFETVTQEEDITETVINPATNEINEQELTESASKQQTNCQPSPSTIYGIDTELQQTHSQFNPKRYNENITLHHLLSHTSGVDKLGRPNLFEPGSQFSYSNLGYSLLAEVLEQVNQQSFAQQLAVFSQANGLGGLYAEVGTIDNIRQRAPSLAIGLNEAGNTLTPSGLEITPSLLPAGGLISTVKAFATFQQKLHSGKLMTPHSYELMTRSHTGIKFLWPDMSYGYGLRINREDNITEYSHTGYLAGYMSMTLHYPEFNMDLVMLENISLSLNDLDRVFELHNKIRSIIRQSLIHRKSLESKSS
ncbi:beta-lactamase family protein [Shewanella eurypsychrophilus]|uniref:Beta-lactamase family protein n=2 Tax=Shewanellaceae TaxID=267890 RepID=A0ABX6VKY4_9GAMM|nr:serine hydrolase [Shewanella sp. YLB-09]QPG60554.1 beta-lactamase family protein [Shewanella eurypsychrophilus]